MLHTDPNDQVPHLESIEQNTGVSDLDRLRGQELRDRAMWKANHRDTYSPVLGLSVALDDGESLIHTAANVGYTVYQEWLDLTDGKDARAGAELLGEETTVEGAEADHKADKKKYYSQILGLFARALVHEHDVRQAAIFALNGTIQAGRDIEMQRTRDKAIEEEIDPKARDLGKYKTVANGIGNGLHTLAPAIQERYRHHVKRTGNIALAIGTGLSLAGLADMKLHVRRKLKLKSDEQIQSPSVCPDKVRADYLRVVPDDTTLEPSQEAPQDHRQ